MKLLKKAYFHCLWADFQNWSIKITSNVPVFLGIPPGNLFEICSPENPSKIPQGIYSEIFPKISSGFPLAVSSEISQESFFFHVSLQRFLQKMILRFLKDRGSLKDDS